MGCEVIISDCEEHHINDVVRMCREFYKHTIYDDPFCDESVYTIIRSSISDNLCMVSIVDGSVVGFIGGIMGAMLMNLSVKMTTELGWWVDKEYRNSGAGLKLIRAFEKRAKELGAKYTNANYMESSMPAEVKKMYLRLGYVENEQVMTRKL